MTREARRRRPGEERLRAEQEAYFAERVNAEPGTGHAYLRFGRDLLATEAWNGIRVESVTLERSYPATVIVVTFTHVDAPDRQFEWTRPLWRPETRHLDEPILGNTAIALSELIALNLDEMLKRPNGTTTRMGTTQAITHDEWMRLNAQGFIRTDRRPGKFLPPETETGG